MSVMGLGVYAWPGRKAIADRVERIRGKEAQMKLCGRKERGKGIEEKNAPRMLSDFVGYHGPR